MKYKLFRILVAVVLVCVLLVSWSPIKAQAVVLESAAIAYAVDAMLVVGAALIGLGVLPNLANQGAFDGIVESAVSALETAGYVVGGMMSVYKVFDLQFDIGLKTDALQFLHNWLYSSGTVSDSNALRLDPTFAVPEWAIAQAALAPYALLVYTSTLGVYGFQLIYSYDAEINLSVTNAGKGSSVSLKTSSSVGYRYDYNVGDFVQFTGTAYNGSLVTALEYQRFGSTVMPNIVTEYDCILGTIAPAGTEIETEYGDYVVIIAPNGVPDTGGGNENEQPKEIPIIPIPVMPSYQQTVQLPQEGIWEGNKIDTGTSDPGTGNDPDSGDGSSVGETPWENFKKWISEGWKSIIQAIPTPDSIAEAVGNVIKSIFVPDADFITEKWNDIRSRFEFADSITATGEVLVNILDGLDPEPPVIYIDLGAAEGSYNIGGEVPFVDLRWYARYKPTMDLIISAFLWLAFVWRLILKLPGIISGMPGEFVLMNLPVNLPHLGIGSGQRREELESGRNNRRLGDGH